MNAGNHPLQRRLAVDGCNYDSIEERKRRLRYLMRVTEEDID